MSLRLVSWRMARLRHFSRCWSCCAIILAFASKKRPMFHAVASVIRLAALSVSEQFSLVLLEFLGPSRSAAAQHPSSTQRRENTAARLCKNTTAFRPRDATTVVIIEDLHWIDAASEEFVEALADAVVGTTTLLVVNFRPGFAAPLMQRSHYRQINMPPLPAAQAAILLQDHFGNDPSLALLSRNIIERAQGNPFFLEELVNALVERGDFEGEKGAYRLKGGIDTIPLPVNGAGRYCSAHRSA